MEKTDTERRRDHIVNLLSSHGDLSAGALAEMLDVTVQTVRADLRMLDEARIVRRRHGVATLNVASENIGYHPRLDVSRDEKSRIAAAVAALIPHGATIALGTGTTVEAVARALTGHKGLTVATNNIHVVLALRMAERATILLAGGEVRLRDLDMIGAESMEFFDGLSFDHAVFSVGGITEEGALLDFNLGEIRARKAIGAAARERTLVVDHAKIGREAPYRWGEMQALERAVCGGPMPPALKAAGAAAGCEVIEA